MAKSINGFQTTRILPLNPDKFTEEDFAPVSADMSFERQRVSLELVHQQWYYEETGFRLMEMLIICQETHGQEQLQTSKMLLLKTKLLHQVTLTGMKSL